MIFKQHKGYTLEKRGEYYYVNQVEFTKLRDAMDYFFDKVL